MARFESSVGDHIQKKHFLLKRKRKMQVEFTDSDLKLSLLRKFEVRHFINKDEVYIDDKWRKGGYGGKTLLVINRFTEHHVPMIIWSYCRPTEQYSRLSGLLTAFQKYLDLNIPGNSIVGYIRPGADSETYVIYYKKTCEIVESDNQPYFWLKA